MIVTLTTDFGLTDHYAGTMKGVILGLCPKAQIIDISHGITPYDIGEAAYTIAQAWRYFPPKTVHVVVVDPGVGSARRPLLVEAAGHRFVGPDNGVFSMIYSASPCKVRHLTNPRFFLQQVSRTFHGRDLFAPVAAHLAAGAPPARMGKLVQDYVQGDFVHPLPAGKGKWNARILKIDLFGNVTTNLRAADFPDLADHKFRLSAGPVKITTLAQSYATAAPGAPLLILGSSGYYEISINQGDAAKALKLQPGARLALKIA
ncbi:MAG: SAM-dependent chlorinase/fluorinase [Candidatus Solibacter sp.]